jgi:hypothetical protein
LIFPKEEVDAALSNRGNFDISKEGAEDALSDREHRYFSNRGLPLIGKNSLVLIIVHLN